VSRRIPGCCHQMLSADLSYRVEGNHPGDRVRWAQMA
jgi:hypothetical protein